MVDLPLFVQLQEVTYVNIAHFNPSCSPNEVGQRLERDKLVQIENWEPVLEVSLYVCLNVRKIMFWDFFFFTQ